MVRFLPRAGFWSVPRRAVRHHVHVVPGVRAVGQRPEDGIGVGRIDILADGDTDFSAVGAQRRRALQPAPDFSPRGPLRKLQKDDLAQIGERLVHDDAS